MLGSPAMNFDISKFVLSRPAIESVSTSFAPCALSTSLEIFHDNIFYAHDLDIQFYVK